MRRKKTSHAASFMNETYRWKIRKDAGGSCRPLQVKFQTKLPLAGSITTTVVAHSYHFETRPMLVDCLNVKRLRICYFKLWCTCEPDTDYLIKYQTCMFYFVCFFWSMHSTALHSIAPYHLSRNTYIFLN